VTFLSLIEYLWLTEAVSYSVEEKNKFSEDPNSCHRHRREVEEAMNDYMTESGFTYGTPRQQMIQAKFQEHMTEKLKDKPEILKTLLPAYPPGCRRREFLLWSTALRCREADAVTVTPGPGYLEAVVQPNVSYISDEVSYVTEEGIVTQDGTLRKVDAIIWATGFNV